LQRGTVERRRPGVELPCRHFRSRTAAPARVHRMRGAAFLPDSEIIRSKRTSTGPGRPTFFRSIPMSDNTQQRIDALVKSNDILLFMKGSASFPMCGFSGRAIQILKACGVDPKSVVTVNVLEDDAIRQGIKEYSNWPTIPQLYVKGEFIGGSDIMMEMYESGELKQVLGTEG
jgi:monothiol glutaredoxin